MSYQVFLHPKANTFLEDAEDELKNRIRKKLHVLKSVPEKGKKLRWGLGKDDISLVDLFKAFSATGTKEEKTKIGKYCFQDCNLVHHLFRKNDIWTGMVEQAAICSIPIDYVVMRGQGIKLLSFIAKKCRAKKTLMPVVKKVDNDGSYAFIGSLSVFCIAVRGQSGEFSLLGLAAAMEAGR